MGSETSGVKVPLRIKLIAGRQTVADWQDTPPEVWAELLGVILQRAAGASVRPESEAEDER